MDLSVPPAGEYAGMQSGIWLMGRMGMDMVLSVENAEKYYGREPNLK